uniref:Putative secreted peptide n=1 Tax=Anopheles braziliensis TaxID=58242 RepID=A0A2M3ZUP9_9DIPT
MVRWRYGGTFLAIRVTSSYTMPTCLCGCGNNAECRMFDRNCIKSITCYSTTPLSTSPQRRNTPCHPTDT